jgi:hypothetical protein
MTWLNCHVTEWVTVLSMPDSSSSGQDAWVCVAVYICACRWQHCIMVSILLGECNNDYIILSRAVYIVKELSYQVISWLPYLPYYICH